ncbi:MAG: hypothetical protein KGZ25_05950 [Planctomycetes bacterium]|nr:hypothetical protein [Planctomycetota bacterium]
MRNGWLIVLFLLIVGIAAPARATNETIHVQARQKDNPQEEAADIEGHFSSEPTGENDEIHVTNPDVNGKAAGVYDDPVNDGALLVITRTEDPVKVEVEGREGIGALYWVTVEPEGGEEGGGGAAPTVLWADVKDQEEAGALVLRDDNTGHGVSDSDNISEDEDGDPDTNLPSLLCTTTDDGRGKVSFWLSGTQSGTYEWTMASTSITGTQTWSTLPYFSSAYNIFPDEYTLTVTKVGDDDFERKISFTVIELRIVRVDTTNGDSGQIEFAVSATIPSGRFHGPGVDRTCTDLGPGQFEFGFSQSALTPRDNPRSDPCFASDTYVLRTAVGNKKVDYSVSDKGSSASEVAVGKIFADDAMITIAVQHDHDQDWYDYDYAAPLVAGSKTIRLWSGGSDIHTTAAEFPTEISVWTEKHWIEDGDGKTVYSSNMKLQNAPTLPPQGPHYRSAHDSVNQFVDVGSGYTSYGKITSLQFDSAAGLVLWIPIANSTTDTRIQE